MNEKKEIEKQIKNSIEEWNHFLLEKMNNNKYISYGMTKNLIKNRNSENPLYRIIDYIKNKICLYMFEDLYCILLLISEHYNPSRDYLSVDQAFNVYYTLNPKKISPNNDRSVYSNIAKKQKNKSSKIYNSSNNKKNINRNNTSVSSFFRFIKNYKSDESSFIYDPFYFYRQSIVNEELKEEKDLRNHSISKSFCLYDTHLMEYLTIGDNRQSYIGKINDELDSYPKKKKDKSKTGIFEFYCHLDEIEGLLNSQEKTTKDFINTNQIMNNRIAFKKRYHMEFFGSLNNQLFSMLLTNTKPYEETLFLNHTEMKHTDFSKFNSMFYYSFLYTLMKYDINLNVLNENLEQYLDASRCVIIDDSLQHSMFFNDVCNSNFYLSIILNSIYALLAEMTEISNDAIFYRLNDLMLNKESKDELERKHKTQKTTGDFIVFTNEDIKLKLDELELFKYAISYVKEKMEDYVRKVNAYEFNKFDLNGSRESILDSEQAESISLKTLIKTTISL